MKLILLIAQTRLIEALLEPVPLAHAMFTRAIIDKLVWTLYSLSPARPVCR